ncbi:MAG: FCD domain-containing protein, partial [Solirubrobacteraceae bacterium]
GTATLADCLEVRNALEPLICGHAAATHAAADIEALSAIIDRMEALSGDPHAYFEANWEFHRRMATLCENAPLQSIYILVCDFLESWLGDLEFDVIEPERIAVHRRLLAAIEGGGGEELERALRAHSENSPLTSASAP